MLKEGSGEPIVLFHGVTCSERVWGRVLPLLSVNHYVVAPTLLGHRGGTAAKKGTRMADVIDDAEAILDRLKLDRPHLAGNSMGGWVAIELARRGRASSVCALSPAGFWDVSSGSQSHATEILKKVVARTQSSRWALPLLSKFGAVRKSAMRANAVNGHRLTDKEFINMADDLLGCSARNDLLNTTEQIEAFNSIPCPIMLAWSQCDRIFPLQVNGEIARKLIPEAEWRVLPNVGHLPMIDDPKLVVETILNSVQRG